MVAVRLISGDSLISWVYKLGSKGCVVIGAGISGLTAAYKLANAGYKITILEKHEYCGGRSYPFIKNGFKADAGAQLIGEDYHHTLKLLNDVGLKKDLVKLNEPTAALYSRKELYLLNFGGMIKYDKLNLREKWDLFRLFKKVKKLGDEKHFTFTNIENENLFDSMSIAEWTIENFNENLLEYVIQPSVTAMTLIEPEKLSAIYGLSLLYADLKGSYTLQNGLSTLGTVLSHQLGGYKVDIKTNCEVKKIAIEGENVFEVEYHQNEEIKDIKTSNVICATPAFITSKIIPSLPKESKSALSKVEYSKGLQVLMGLKKRIWDKTWGILIPRRELDGIPMINESTLKCKNFAPTGKGLFEIYVKCSSDDTLLNKDKTKILDFILDKMEDIFPHIAENVEWYDVLKWNVLMQRHSPNFSELRKDFQTQISGLALAGDYLFLPSLESAVYSGIKAAEHIA